MVCRLADTAHTTQSRGTRNRKGEVTCNDRNQHIVELKCWDMTLGLLRLCLGFFTSHSAWGTHLERLVARSQGWQMGAVYRHVGVWERVNHTEVRFWVACTGWPSKLWLAFSTLSKSGTSRHQSKSWLPEPWYQTTSSSEKCWEP